MPYTGIQGKIIKVPIKIDNFKLPVEDNVLPHKYPGYLGMKAIYAEALGINQSEIQGPIIRSIYNLGPFHKARLGSIIPVIYQERLPAVGDISISIVATLVEITGVFYKGDYYPNPIISKLNYLAEEAYKNKEGLIIEARLWYRDISRIEALNYAFNNYPLPEFENGGSKFVKVNPMLSSIEAIDIKFDDEDTRDKE